MSKEEWDKDRSLDLDSYKTGYLQAIEDALRVAEQDVVDCSDGYYSCEMPTHVAKAIAKSIRALKPNEGKG